MKNVLYPLSREFLGGMFGGDGHTSFLGMHRDKKDLLTSVSISFTKTKSQLKSLERMMEQIAELLARCGITNTTIQQAKETTLSKQKNTFNEKHYQVLLHVKIDQLILFSERVGFRHCLHKSQRLEAAVAYRKLRENVIRQRNWLTERVRELVGYPCKLVNSSMKIAITQAKNELAVIEPILHRYGIPKPRDIRDHLTRGTKFGKFSSKSFPIAEEFLENIGAIDFFVTKEEQKSNVNNEDEDTKQLSEQFDDLGCSSTKKKHKVAYGLLRENNHLATFKLKVLSCKSIGSHPVYGIETERGQFIPDKWCGNS